MKIAVLGYGTVGSGVVEILDRNAKTIASRVGEEIEVKYILDLKDFPGTPIEHKIVHDINTIIEDEEVKIVVEVMGGVDVPYKFVKAALLAGKSAVTSNKALVAAKGEELLDIATKNNISFLFEASVGGGIPIIRPLNQALTADEFVEINGILNGTTNFILSKMTDEGSDFDAVLREAQSLGYAERDPSADVEGYDACRKIAILSSIAFGKTLNYEDIKTVGITKVSAVDIAYAKSLGKKIKLLASAKSVSDKVFAMVAPFMISSEHPLYNIDGVTNAVHVNGNMVGDVIFTGPGAGKLPTASAVVSDVIEITKTGGNIPSNWKAGKLELIDCSDFECQFFVRVKKEEVSIEEINSLFGDVNTLTLEDYADTEFAFFTKEIKEGEFAEKYSKLKGAISSIRVGR